MSHDALDLPVDIFHRWRKKTFQPVLAAFFRAEGRTLVKNGVVQQRDTMQSIVRLRLSDLYHIGSPVFQSVGLQLVELPSAPALCTAATTPTAYAASMSTP